MLSGGTFINLKNTTALTLVNWQVYANNDRNNLNDVSSLNELNKTKLLKLIEPFKSAERGTGPCSLVVLAWNDLNVERGT